jgi:hypothetical protein
MQKPGLRKGRVEGDRGAHMTVSTVKTTLLLVLGLTLCCLGEQTATGQPAPASSPNADPDRVRAIVRAGAEKAGTQAVVFGTWVHDREVVTMALGHSMTTVPAPRICIIASAGSPRPLCPRSC